MDNHCAICGAYLADTGRMVCPNCEKPSMTNEQAIEMLKNPQKYMFVHDGEIELEGWLKEAINMGIEELKRRAEDGRDK